MDGLQQQDSYEHNSQPLKRNEMFIVIPDKTFYSGEIVKGVIELHVLHPTVSHQLTVSLIGRETTDFTLKCKEVNTFLSKKVTLKLPTQDESTESTATSFVIPSGKFRIPFSFSLPNALPPSYKHPQQTAAIDYKVQASLKPAGWNDHSVGSTSVKLLSELESEKVVHVGGTLFDASFVQHVQGLDLKISESRFVSSTDGALDCTLSVDSKIARPGEFLHFNLDLHNGSEQRVSAMVAKLVQHVEYFSMDKKVAEEDFEVGFCNIGTVPPKSEIHHTKQIGIPEATVESVMQKIFAGSCTFGKMVRISYYLFVSIDVLMKPFMVLHIPIFVLRKTMAQLLTIPNVTANVKSTVMASPMRESIDVPSNYNTTKTSSGMIVSPRKPITYDDVEDDDEAPVPVKSPLQSSFASPRSLSPRKMPSSSPAVYTHLPETKGSPTKRVRINDTPISHQKGATPVHEALNIESPRKQLPKSPSSPHHSPQKGRTALIMPILNSPPPADKASPAKSVMFSPMTESKPIKFVESPAKADAVPSRKKRLEVEQEIENNKIKLNQINELVQEELSFSPKSPRMTTTMTTSTTTTKSPISPKQQAKDPYTDMPLQPQETTLKALPSPSFTGKATYFYPDGSKYTGSWLGGKRHGKGKLKYSDGSVYTGEWYNDYRHGYGIYSNQNYTYDGQWKLDIKHGQGLIIYANGEQYDGNWENNFPSGKGEYVFKDSSRHVGEFQSGVRHGKGILYYADGETVYNGDWVNDKKHGKAVITFNNGQYEGDMRNDVKEV